MRRTGADRRGRLIQEFLDSKKMKISDVARRVGVSYTAAYETVRGRQNNRKVLTLLLKLGADPAYMDLPPNMQRDVMEVV